MELMSVLRHTEQSNYFLWILCLLELCQYIQALTCYQCVYLKAQDSDGNDFIDAYKPQQNDFFTADCVSKLEKLTAVDCPGRCAEANVTADVKKSKEGSETFSVDGIMRSCLPNLKQGTQKCASLEKLKIVKLGLMRKFLPKTGSTIQGTGCLCNAEKCNANPGDLKLVKQTTIMLPETTEMSKLTTVQVNVSDLMSLDYSEMSASNFQSAPIFLTFISFILDKNAQF